MPLALPAEALPPAIRACPVAMEYHTLLGRLPWAEFPERSTARPWPGPSPEPRAPFAAAILVKLHEHHPSMGHLCRFLHHHPALAWLLGFPRVPDPTAPFGLQQRAIVPSRSRVCRVLRSMPNAALQWLLTQTVHLIQASIPPDAVATFAEVIAGDTKHILAWVKENNPKQFIPEGRLDPTRQPAGDPDCRLGVKKRRNTSPTADPATSGGDDDPPTPAAEPIPVSRLQVGTEILWGYASGVVATAIPGWGEIVLAERTRPFNEDDISYFAPLMAQVDARLTRRPRIGVWDTAFDAHYVHDYFYHAGGFAAVPCNTGKRGGDRQFAAGGQPLCAAGVAMPVTKTYCSRTINLTPHRRSIHRCPLLVPTPTAEACPIDDPHWERGGCTTTLATSMGARIRILLDRESPIYQAAYAQRTIVERINSQATALGIERPKLRNGAAIANQNTLLYVLLNLRAVQRQTAPAVNLSA
jgi:hypothetical protein